MSVTGARALAALNRSHGRQNHQHMGRPRREEETHTHTLHESVTPTYTQFLCQIRYKIKLPDGFYSGVVLFVSRPFWPPTFYLSRNRRTCPLEANEF
ncbi:Hypothetical predicted protein [Cloeon dipterum]|uniref:Uncharacterized protein n=1 Tax=Cloeon dipterum TaxID=197152 RepID=A0A8S1CL62_9INSE|nr:Hypothetical predicted protein [Cloeon dipterum]